MAESKNKGGDRVMSIYGLHSAATPDAAARLGKYNSKREQAIHRQHLTTKGNGTSTWPGVPPLSQEAMDNASKSVFGTGKQGGPSRAATSTRTYDRINKTEEGYSQRLHRDDAQYLVGLHSRAEEKQRNVPLLSNSEIGHRVHQPLDFTARGHTRVNTTLNAVYHRNGTGIPTSRDLHPSSPS